MTLSYTTGLTVGSLLAYMMDTCFGLSSVHAKDVCYKVLKLSVMPDNGTTSSILVNTVSSTLSMLDTVTPKVNATVSVLSTVFNSTIFSNSTISTLTTSMADASTTVSSKIFLNVTASVNSAILQH